MPLGGLLLNFSAKGTEIRCAPALSDTHTHTLQQLSWLCRCWELGLERAEGFPSQVTVCDI